MAFPAGGSARSGAARRARTARWGSYRGGHIGPGVIHSRLVLFPPGTTEQEGRLLRGWRCWPVAGAAAAGLAAATFVLVLPVALALVTAAILYVVATLELRHLVRRQRAHICVLDAEHVAAARDADTLDRCRTLARLGSALVESEAAYDDGDISAVEFERLWGVAYDEARLLA